jgi:hypothetical protein
MTSLNFRGTSTAILALRRAGFAPVQQVTGRDKNMAGRQFVLRDLPVQVRYDPESLQRQVRMDRVNLR